MHSITGSTCRAKCSNILHDTLYTGKWSTSCLLTNIRLDFCSTVSNEEMFYKLNSSCQSNETFFLLLMVRINKLDSFYCPVQKATLVPPSTMVIVLTQFASLKKLFSFFLTGVQKGQTVLFFPLSDTRDKKLKKCWFLANLFNLHLHLRVLSSS